ncbi:MAG: hypothetical protein AB7I30_17115 [Isosphaeraceae bacterium]
MSPSFRQVCWAIIATSIPLGISPSSSRAQVIIPLDAPINGAAPPGTLTATFRDAGADTVRLTMDATGLTGSDQYVPVWLFNLTPSWDFGANPLTFTHFGGIEAESVSASLNGYDGGSNVKGGLFDVQFSFKTSNSGTPPLTRLSAGTSSVYTIVGNGLSASSFSALSAPGGGRPGGYFSAADVRAIPPSGGSGSIGAPSLASVPEPSPVALSMLLGVALLGRLGWRRIRRRAC